MLKWHKMPDDVRVRGFAANNVVFLDVETLITFLITLCFGLCSVELMLCSLLLVSAYSRF